MKKHFTMVLTVWLATGWWTWNAVLHAEEELRYIRDVLYVPLRTGQGAAYRIVHKGLVSGTPVTVLAVSEDGTYTQVRTQYGAEGWLQSQYLMEEPAARDQLVELEHTNEVLQEQLEAYQLAQASAISKENPDALLGIVPDRGEQREVLLESESASQQLRHENQVLKNELDLLLADNNRLRDTRSNDAFLNGALAVLLGVVIALLVSRLWPKKNTGW